MKIKNENIAHIILVRINIIHILACCVLADVSKKQPQLKHILSILLVHPFLAYVPYKTQMKLICSPLQQSAKTSLKKEVTHL